MRTCAICHREFEPMSRNQKTTCGSLDCQRRQRNRRARARYQSISTATEGRMWIPRDFGDPWENFQHQITGHVTDTQLCPLG